MEMKRRSRPQPLLAAAVIITIVVSSLSVGSAGEVGRKLIGDSPLTAKASVIRYWKKEVSNDLPKPWFLLNKASPLDAVQLARFSKLAGQNSLSAELSSFCTKANLLCFRDLSASDKDVHEEDADFKRYSMQNFTNYGSKRGGGVDSFKNYTNDENLPVDSFRRYSRDAVGHDDQFTSYGVDGNVVDQKFNTYGAGATGGAGKFSAYNDEANQPGLDFASYSDRALGRNQGFKGYAGDGNAGKESFTNYGKNGNAAANQFTTYGNESNVVSSNFKNYGQTANGGADNFTSYGSDGNVPDNNFVNYGAGGNGAVESFSSYRDRANVGDDSFKSYAKGSNAANLGFTNYGKSFNEGTDKFAQYAQDSTSQTVNFKGYGKNNTFTEYAKTRVTFAMYSNESTTSAANGTTITAEGKTGMKNKWIAPGKFFREKMLKQGTVMPMPDIKDRMPKRSFLPRVILTKLPFSSSKIDMLKKTFHAGDDSTMAGIMGKALTECERPPSAGETKRCVGSAEDMIDFATSILGRNVVVRTTENVNGSGRDIMIGNVKGINGGKVTESVSCHQSLYPHLLYYCHSVPKVRVYQADILDPQSKEKINDGVAICHIDTSMWSSGHGAFMALGSGPGRIEVCHWIFENDMTWAKADT